MLEGNNINLIRKGLLSYSPKKYYYELWLHGAIMTVNDQKEVNRIDQILKEAKKINANEKEYLQYCLINEDY